MYDVSFVAELSCIRKKNDFVGFIKEKKSYKMQPVHAQKQEKIQRVSLTFSIINCKHLIDIRHACWYMQLGGNQTACIICEVS